MRRILLLPSFNSLLFMFSNALAMVFDVWTPMQLGATNPFSPFHQRPFSETLWRLSRENETHHRSYIRSKRFCSFSHRLRMPHPQDPWPWAFHNFDKTFRPGCVISCAFSICSETALPASCQELCPPAIIICRCQLQLCKGAVSGMSHRIPKIIRSNLCAIVTPRLRRQCHKQCC